MAIFAIVWEYLTGKSVATDPANRRQAEWPPHPARVFMALAAAWFETGQPEPAGRALHWLESLGDPSLLFPESAFPRDVVDCYVPVNDQESVSGINRVRHARNFPSTWLGGTPCYLVWPEVSESDVATHRDSLAALCHEVTRIGHSSSLVRMWVADELPSSTSMARFDPGQDLPNFHLRKVTEGTIEMLQSQYAQKPPMRPVISLSTGYRRHHETPQPIVNESAFDHDLLILTQVDGPRLPITASLTVTRAMRGAIMSHLQNNIPAWVSGHLPDGQPLQNDNGHLAVLPLPFVGSQHADGHLLGIALAFPRTVTREERGRVLGPLLVNEVGQTLQLELRLGPLGVCVVRKTDWMENRLSLQPDIWTAFPQRSRVWASATPVVLDRYPKSDRRGDHLARRSEVADILSAACERIGLPAPRQVEFGTTSWLAGSPRATRKLRPLRGHPELEIKQAPLGDGFSDYPAKQGSRPQVHVWLSFAEPVLGPVLIGSGRFLGYGLCRPLIPDHHS